MYVMGHSPGQSAQSWRRQFYTDLGHGMKILDLYSFKVKPGRSRLAQWSAQKVHFLPLHTFFVFAVNGW